MPSSRPVVGFVGLGRMGSRMLSNVMKSHRVVVWNRTQEKCREYVEKGALMASSPRELAEKSDIVVSMLSTPQVTEDVIGGYGGYRGSAVIDGLKEGEIVVDMSTNSPTVVKRLAELIRSKGGELVDAPVLGSIPLAAEGTLTILASGSRSAVERAQPVLESMGKRVWYLGEVGTASAVKLVFNLHLWIMTAAFAEAFTFAVKMGADPKTTLEIWNSSTQKTYISEFKGPKALSGDWSPAFTIELAMKDMRLALEMASDAGFPLPVGSVVKELYTACISLGMRDLDIGALVKLYEQLGSVKVAGR